MKITPSKNRFNRRLFILSIAALTLLSLTSHTQANVLNAWGKHENPEYPGDTSALGLADILSSSTTFVPLPLKVTGLSGIKSVSVGYDFTLALMENGTVKSWGSNFDGTLGTGDLVDAGVPVSVKTYGIRGTKIDLCGVKQVAAGTMHSLALLNNGTILAWGRAEQSQLGFIPERDALHVSMPTQVPGLSDVIQVAAGTFHSLALKQDGTVWAWGFNKKGELGYGTAGVSSSVPTKVPGLSGVKQIAAGCYFSLALLNDGTVRGWGWNKHGELGTGIAWEDYRTTVVKAAVAGVKQISTMSNSLHVLALMNDGTVKSWGRNTYGQLGLGHTSHSAIPTTVPGLSSVKQVAVGTDHSMALLNDGTVRTWGSAGHGELGVVMNYNPEAMKTVPVYVPMLFGVQQIAAGRYTSFAIRK